MRSDHHPYQNVVNDGDVKMFDNGKEVRLRNNAMHKHSTANESKGGRHGRSIQKAKQYSKQKFKGEPYNARQSVDLKTSYEHNH